MSFARPDLLWLMLLAVPVVILHMVRRRRVRQRIPSLLLWERVLSRSPRRASLGVLAALLSLLLFLLALGAGVLAAAGASRGEAAPPPRHLLLALGASARMEGDRFTRAVALALEEVRRKAPVDPVTVMLVSERPRVLATRERDPGRLASALASARPSLLRAAWPLVAPAMRDVLAEGGRAVAIGVAPAAPPGAAVHPVGGANAGLAAFDVRLREESVDVFLRAEGAAAGTEVVVDLAGRELARRPAVGEISLTLERGGGGLLRVALDPGTGPAFDDAAEAWIPPRRRLRVGVAGEGGPDPFLRSALRVVDLVDAEGSGTIPPDELISAAIEFDVVVVAGIEVPAALPPGDYLLLTPPPTALGFVPLLAPESSPIWEQARDHPVIRGVDAAEVQVVGAVPARLPPEAEALFTVPGGAVAALGERNGVRFVWIGLAPENSTLPVTAAFPLLVRNSLRWFASLRGEPLPPAFALGEELEPASPLPKGIAAVAIAGPGDEHSVVDARGGSFSWRPEGLVEGEVRVRIGTAEHRTRLNAVLPEETSAEPLPGEPVLSPDRSGLRDTRERLWALLAAASAVFLLLEWAAHHLTRAG